ncbi:unnamed protein product, partial [Staurois parvus]
KRTTARHQLRDSRRTTARHQLRNCRRTTARHQLRNCRRTTARHQLRNCRRTTVRHQLRDSRRTTTKLKSNMSLKIRAMNIFMTLILFEVVSSTEEVVHLREKRGTRTYKSLCSEKSSGRVFKDNETWLRPAGRRVEFCRCEDGRNQCHSVPFMSKGRIK